MFPCLFQVNAIIASAQTARLININTNNFSLVFAVGTNGRLYQTYIGKKLINPADYAVITGMRHEAYITGSMEDQFQPAIKVTHADANPSLELKYISDTQTDQDDNVNETVIRLKDPQYPVEVNLHYQAFKLENVIKTWTEIKNDEKGALVLTNYASSMLHFDAAKYRLTQFHGDWATEMKMQESQLTYGIKQIDILAKPSKAVPGAGN